MKLTAKGRLASFALAGLLAAAPAFAQTAAPQAGQPSAAQIALGKDIVKRSAIDRSFELAISQLTQQTVSRVSATRPDLVRPLDEASKIVIPEFQTDVDAMTDRAARIYAERFSEAELKAIADFLGSPIGQRYIKNQQPIMFDIAQAFAGWQQDVSQRVVTRLRDELKKKGHEF